jgi:hypothetical protein
VEGCPGAGVFYRCSKYPIWLSGHSPLRKWSMALRSCFEAWLRISWALVHPSGIIVTIGQGCRNCLLRPGLPSQPLHAVLPILLREVFERLSYSTDEHAERFVGNARRHKNHVRVGSPLFGPPSEEGLEVAHVGGHQHPAFCESQLKDRRVFHSFEHAFRSPRPARRDRSRPKPCPPHDRRGGRRA